MNEQVQTVEEQEQVEVTLEEVLESIDETIATEKANIELNASLERLQKNKDFHNVIGTVFLENGKEFLWGNIRRNEELDLLEKGSTREGNTDKFKTEVQARLILERFFTRVKEDGEAAVDALEQAEEIREGVIKEMEGEANA